MDLMTNLDNKVKSIFPDESIYKSPNIYSCFTGYNLPAFIKDWLLKRYSGPSGPNIEKIKGFLEKHIPTKDYDVKTRSLNRETVKVLTRILIEADIKSNVYRFSIPDLGINFSEGRVAMSLMRQKDLLNSGENWGIATLEYVAPDEFSKEKGYIELNAFQSFKPYSPDLSYYCHARSSFSTEEWIDFLISCMEYNPNSEQFDSISRKLMFLSRLLVFVEPNLNMIELAPKGTGKSYVFNNLSKYGWHISGGKITRAKLFADMHGRLGIIPNYEFVSLDEIKTISFGGDSAEIVGGLKSYLEDGTITVGKSKQTSSCGMILLGNIDLNIQGLPENKIYFNELPEVFHDTALLVRFHGFIEGWKLPVMQQDLIFTGYTLNVEYFSEILSMLRKDPQYVKIVESFLSIPKDADTRDKKAIIRIATGYVRLLFPNAKCKEDISSSDFYNYCFYPAYEKRKIIKQQLAYMDPQYAKGQLMPNIKVIGYDE